MATSPLVPGRLPVAIEDHAYQIEPSKFQRETVQVLRQQADVSTEPGEASLNPAGLWRRSQESWHHGAGQDFLDGRDEKAADPHRFRSSKGVDIWTRGEVSLLHPVMKVWSTTNTNLHMAVAHDGFAFYLHVADGNEAYWNAMPFTGYNTAAVQNGTGWTPTNATIAAQNNGFRLTATSAAAIGATSPTGTNGIPVEAGRQYVWAVQSQFDGGGGGAARNYRVQVNWYDAAGSLISTSAGSTGGPDVLFVIYDNGFAPANAAFASLTITYLTASTVGERHDINVSFGPYGAVNPLVAPEAWSKSNVGGGQPIQSMATNGFHVWLATGTAGLRRTAAGGGSTAANVPAAPGGGQIHLVGYANGFLLAAGSATSTTGKNTLWAVNTPTGAATLSAAIKTHENSSFAWTGIAPGRNCVYAFGNSGANGEIYKISFDQNTGTLSSAASFASYLPDGETIHALQFYAGGIILGTGKGIRLGQADGAGNIDYGPLIETEWPVQCLEPQGRHCWFGWTKYDTQTSGLGRIDLGYFTDTLTPAYASDLMTNETTSGDVVSCVTFSPYGYTANQRPPVRVFSVAGKGVYIEDPSSRVTTGTLSTGTIRFSTSEPKTTRSVDVRHHALPTSASIGVEQQRDTSGTWTSLGSSSTAASYGPATPLDAGSLSAEALEYRFTLNRTPAGTGVNFSLSPELTRWTAKVLPTPSTIDETFTIPIILRREVVDNNDSNYTYPNGVAAEITYLKGLERARTLVNLQLGAEQHTVYIAGSQLEGANWGPGKAYMECMYTVLCQTVRG